MDEAGEEVAERTSGRSHEGPSKLRARQVVVPNTTPIPTFATHSLIRYVVALSVHAYTGSLPCQCPLVANAAASTWRYLTQTADTVTTATLVS